MTMKASKPALLSTVLDVRLLDQEITPTYFPDNMIEHYMRLGDGEILATLRPIYGSDLTSGITPWASIPVIPPTYTDETANTGLTGAKGARGLVAVTVGATAITEYWQIVFTSATAWTLVGSASMAQGTFTDITSDHAADDADVTIDKDAWDGTPAEGDDVYFATYAVPQLIVWLSARNALWMLLMGKYTEQAPNASEHVDQYRQQVEFYLDKLSRPDDADGIHLEGIPSHDISPIEGMPEYSISPDGRDLSDYADFEFTGFGHRD